MMQLPNPEAENVEIKTNKEQFSNLLLLNGKQWLYVQSLYNLTPREREIAELICQGLRSCNIAKSLRIKQGTVKTHTRNIYRKVRVQSKIAMLLRFVSDTKELSIA